MEEASDMRSGRGQAELRGQQNPRAELAEHETRMENMLLIGHIVDIDYKAGKARVNIDVSPGVTTDWLPWAVPNAGRNGYWFPPHIGEQVQIESWSGNVADGVISGSLNDANHPHVAQSGNIERIVYEMPSNGQISDIFSHSFYDYQRDAGHRWNYLSSGTFRWQVLKGSDGAGIVMNDEHIQLRVKDTQLVVKNGVISAHINGKTTEVWLEKDRIMMQVQDKSYYEITPAKIEASVISADGTKSGFWRLQAEAFMATVCGKGQLWLSALAAELSTSSSSFTRVTDTVVEMTLLHAQSRLAVAVSGITAFFTTSWLTINTFLAELKTNGSSIAATPANVMIETPELLIPNPVIIAAASAPPAEYQASPQTNAQVKLTPVDVDPHVTVAPPEIVLGVPPYYPDKATSEDT